MSRELWWARLVSTSPRYADWFGILGTDKVPLRSPAEGETEFVGEGKFNVYVLDLDKLSEEQFDRLTSFVARKFKADLEVVRQEVRRDGFPIRAEDVCISYDMRAFL
jgi:hypothetical protein